MRKSSNNIQPASSKILSNPLNLNILMQLVGASRYVLFHVQANLVESKAITANNCSLL